MQLETVHRGGLGGSAQQAICARAPLSSQWTRVQSRSHHNIQTLLQQLDQIILRLVNLVNGKLPGLCCTRFGGFSSLCFIAFHSHGHVDAPLGPTPARTQPSTVWPLSLPCSLASQPRPLPSPSEATPPCLLGGAPCTGRSPGLPREPVVNSVHCVVLGPSWQRTSNSQLVQICKN